MPPLGAGLAGSLGSLPPAPGASPAAPAPPAAAPVRPPAQSPDPGPTRPGEGLPPGDTRPPTPTPGECPGSVGLVGDSITAAAPYRQALEARCPGTRFTNAPGAYAFPGKSSRQMLADFETPLGAGHDVLVLLGGVNNNGEPGQVKADLGAMYDRARDRGVKLVAVTIMPYKGYPSWRPANGEHVRAIDAWIREQAAAGRFSGLVDAFALFSDPADPDAARPGWTSDRLHPNATGYAALAEAVVTALGAAR